MFTLGKGSILPGKGVGPIRLDMTYEDIRKIITEYEIEDRDISNVLICGDVMVWIDKKKNRTTQILVYGTFQGKYEDKIGIGSTLADVENSLHTTWHENLDSYLLDHVSGMSFELGDSGNDTYWDEMTAPIETISIFHATEP